MLKRMIMERTLKALITPVTPSRRGAHLLPQFITCLLIVCPVVFGADVPPPAAP